MLSYTYSEIRDTSKRWYLEFYVQNPKTGIKARKRIYIREYKSLQLRVKHAKKLQDLINRKLDQGWNPFVSEEKSTRQFTSLFIAFDFVLALRTKECEPSSLQNYRSRIAIIKKWLKENKMERILCNEFTADIAMQFMNDVFLHHNIGNVTWNGYLIDFRGFCNTLLKNKYLSDNPFKELKKKKPRAKTKMPWSMDQQRDFLRYVLAKDRDFYIISMYCYYLAIRPKEICMLKVKHVNLDTGSITIPEEISKNDRPRTLPIPNPILADLIIHLQNKHPEHYICGKNFIPGPNKIAPTRIAERFRYIADLLGFGPEIKFYGLKDTAAEMLIRAGVHVKTIQMLFDHTDLATTDAYMSRISAPQLEQLRGNFPSFGLSINTSSSL